MNNSEKAKIQVGQKLWLVPAHYYSKDSREPQEEIVSKVGRKYFELQEQPKRKYSIETLQEEIDSSYKGQCYLSLQEILEKREREALINKVKQIFGSYGNPKEITLEQMRKIAEVLQIKD